MFTSGWACPTLWLILGFWGSKIHIKNVTFSAKTPMNRRAIFDATSFIFGGEICNRTKLQTKKQ